MYRIIANTKKQMIVKQQRSLDDQTQEKSNIHIKEINLKKSKDKRQVCRFSKVDIFHVGARKTKNEI